MGEERELTQKEENILISMAITKIIVEVEEQQDCMSTTIKNFELLYKLYTNMETKLAEVTTKMTYLSNAYEVVQDDLQLAFKQLKELKK